MPLKSRYDLRTVQALLLEEKFNIVETIAPAIVTVNFATSRLCSDVLEAIIYVTT